MSGKSVFRRTKKRDRSLTKERRTGNKFPERAPWATERFQMQIGEPAGRIRILNPGDDGFLTINQHRTNGWKTHTCTEDQPGFDGDCVFCNYWAKAEKGTEDKRNLYPKTMTAVELIDFRYHHIVERPNRQGEMRKVVVRCEYDTPEIPTRGRGPKCPHCEDAKDPGSTTSERFFGGHKVWEMSSKQRKMLEAINTELGGTAFYKDHEGYVTELNAYTIGFRCNSCHHEALSEEQFNSMTDEEVDDFASDDWTCPECGNVDLPEEVWIGEDVEQNEYNMDDDSVYRASIFDKDIEILCTGDKLNLGNGETRDVRSFSFDKSKFAFGLVSASLEEMGLDEQGVEDALAPWDLMDKFYRPEFLRTQKFEDEDGNVNFDAYVDAVLDRQAAALKRDNPFPKRSDDSGAVSSGSGGSSRSFPRRR